MSLDAAKLPPGLEGPPAPSENLRIAVLETRIGDFDKRFDAQAEAYARAEMLLAAFGLLLTFLVIYLGWKVEKSAIQSATSIAKDDLKNSKQEVESCVSDARTVLSEAKGILLDIQGHKALAAESVQEIRVMTSAITQSSEKKR